MDALDELGDLIERHSRDGGGSTAIPRVSLLRSEVPTTSIQAIVEPVFCAVAQGRKQAILGDAVFDYGAGQYVVASVDLPNERSHRLMARLGFAPCGESDGPKYRVRNYEALRRSGT